MKKSIILLGAFALLMTVPSFGQTQESTTATTNPNSEKSADLQKQEVQPQKENAKLEVKSMKAQKVKAIAPAQSQANRDIQKADAVKMKPQEATPIEN